MVFSSQIYTGEDDGESVYLYDGIPGCGCFYHCKCYSDMWNSSSKTHNSPEDIVWHTFMEQILKAINVGPYIRYSNSNLCQSLGYIGGHDLSMFSDYLNAIEICKQIFEQEGQNNLNLLKKYPPSDPKDLEKEIFRITKQISDAKAVLSSIIDTIIPLYKNILTECKHKGAYNLALTYNEGLLGFVTGDYETSLNQINEFILFAESLKLREKLLNSKIYQKQGESQLEVGLYHEAIATLTKSIQKDSMNKESYFSRAAAYFEIGDFASAIADYLTSEIISTNTQIPQVSSEFSSALLKGIVDGGKEAAVEFVPSLCNTAHGLGKSLWCFMQQPIDTTAHFCHTSYKAGEAVLEYFKTLDQTKIDHIADEVVQLYNTYDSLSDSEKGNAIGYCIGKYGVDIFAGATTYKCANALKNLKNANRACNLEAMIASPASREAMVTAAMQHAAEREAFFKNVKIHWDKQNKHIPGKHNYELEKSTFEHNDAQGLLTNFAGKGKAANNMTVGSPGYRERIDFGEFIGYYISDSDKTLKIPTSKGIIHYSKSGAHIIPANPEGF
jgi:tetratricopeptide (TPR) repeat protein